MEKIKSIKELNGLISEMARPGIITNNFLAPSQYKTVISEGRLFWKSSDNCLLLLEDMNGWFKCMFYVLEPKPLPLPETYSVTIEIADKPKGTILDSMGAILATQGFTPRFSRNRMALSRPSPENPRRAMRADISQLEQIERLMENSFDEYGGNLLSPRQLRRDIENGLFITEFIGGELYGLLHYSVSGQTAQIEHLAVSENYRRQGIATRLFQEFAILPQKRLRLWVRCWNTPAESFYQKQGFEFDGWRSTVFFKQ